MLAARWHGRRDLRVEDIADPASPPPGWVRLRIEACGICGTDIEEYAAGPIMIPLRPNKLSGNAAPLTMGHEAAGVVEEVSDGVELAVGAKVAIEANMFCGECHWCRLGDYQLCPDLASLGLMGDGALAEQMLAPAYMCIPYADGLSPEQAAMAEPLSVAVRAVRRGGVRDGVSIGVIGAGTIGLLALQAARIAGANTTVVVERHAKRRELALALGATTAITPADASTAVADLTAGLGLDIVIEAAGNPNASKLAIELTRHGGRTVLLGVFDGAVPVRMMDLLMGEREIVSSMSHTYDKDFAAAVDLIGRGLVSVEPVITDRISLRDVVEGGFEKLIAEPDEHLKMTVLPTR